MVLVSLETEILNMGFFFLSGWCTQLLPAHCLVRSNLRKEKSCEWKVFYADGLLMSAHLTGYGKNIAEELYFQLFQE